MLVAVRQDGGHLAEERCGLGLQEAPPAAHQAVHVPMRPWEEGVEVPRACQDLHRPGHMAVVGQPQVGLQHRQGLAGRVHLWEHGVNTGGDPVGPRSALQPVTANYCVLGLVPQRFSSRSLNPDQAEGHMASKGQSCD